MKETVRTANVRSAKIKWQSRITSRPKTKLRISPDLHGQPSPAEGVDETFHTTELRFTT